MPTRKKIKPDESQLGTLFTLFLMLSLLILIPAVILQRQYGYLWIDIIENKVFNITPYLLLTISLILSIVASIYSYVLNLYYIPGIQPDSFLVSMDFGVLGSFIVSMLFSLIVIWYIPLILQIIV